MIRATLFILVLLSVAGCFFPELKNRGPLIDGNELLSQCREERILGRRALVCKGFHFNLLPNTGYYFDLRKVDEYDVVAFQDWYLETAATDRPILLVDVAKDQTLSINELCCTVGSADLYNYKGLIIIQGDPEGSNVIVDARKLYLRNIVVINSELNWKGEYR